MRIVLFVQALLQALQEFFAALVEPFAGLCRLLLELSYAGADVLADAVRDLRRKSLRPLRNALQLVSNPLTKFALACSYLLVDGGFGRAKYLLGLLPGLLQGAGP